MNRFFLHIVILFVCASAVAQKSLNNLLTQYNTRSIPYISAEETRMLQLNDTVIILDSREQEEFDVSHIPSARFIGFNSFSSERVSEEIKDKNIPIVVYCSLGIRSEEIAEKLKKAGFTNLRNLYGGIFEWVNKEFPVVDSEEKKTLNVHTFNKHWSQWLEKGTKIYNTVN
ncbi:rhodanese-like domain-containing protein [Ulvibacter antarcticus]|uniref:Rhodanese-related sulfurtransferase n=1 Tax=Ulvibacter antarcticus TaxID=442714 RepID=A0A3L9Z4T2_9FLAO|nr:rhodanese-like domain-containing protein [Ulvibacter antarcticus]RMA66469.1 rhodanese-related sulfurtransferase [Ulvibacter antarcticus]